MKTLTNKLMLSIMSAVLAVIALGATTFAWFTLSNQVIIQPFYGDITAGEGIEVSLDGVTWYSSITQTTMHNYLFNGYTDGNGDLQTGKFGTEFQFNEVTSEDGQAFKNYGGAPIMESGFTNKFPYLVFTLQFRSIEPADIYVEEIEFLDNLGGDLAVMWRPDIEFTSAKGVSLDTTEDSIRPYYAKDAARISFFTTENNLVFQEDETSTNTPLTHVSGNMIPDFADGAHDYYFQKNDQYPEGSHDVTLPQTLLLDDIDISNSAQKLITLTKTGEATHFTGNVEVRIWIEGWDQDCFNAILAARLAVRFKFIGIEPAE